MSKLKTVCMNCHKVFKVMKVSDGKEREMVSHGYCSEKCMEEQMKELNEQDKKDARISTR